MIFSKPGAIKWVQDNPIHVRGAKDFVGIKIETKKAEMKSIFSLATCANLEVLVGIASIIVGALLIIAPGTAVFSAYNATIAGAFWGGEVLSDSALRMNHWLLATCGAGVVGWGIAWAAIAHIPFRAGERWSWLCLSVSLGIWVSLDLVIALWFGVAGEVMFVLAALFVGALPLLLATPHFQKNS